MKTQKTMFIAIAMIATMIFQTSCNQEKIDPALVLDETFIPAGYSQIDNPPSDALARLEELRLENPKDHYYYLKRNDLNSNKWVFPQQELKIESVSYDETAPADKRNEAIGVIVKKIKGDYRNEEFMVVESQPAPKTGLKAFYQYIQENMKYPEEAKEAGIQGKVFVEFVVDDNGKLTQVKAVKGIGAGCDEEAVRVIKEAPAWTPGMVVDMPVKVKMILPISYRLS